MRNELDQNALDICMLLADNDKTLDRKQIVMLKEEVGRIWPLLRASGANQFGEHDAVDAWIREQEDKMSDTVEFAQFGELLAQAREKHSVDIEQLQKDVYREVNVQYFRKSKSCCICLFKCPCIIACCRCYRRSAVASKLNQKNAKERHYSLVQIGKQLFHQLIHTFDLYTDLALAHRMYQLREEEWALTRNLNSHYHWAFIWIVMASFGPYIIQYSTRMNADFHKGYFQKDNWNDHKCYRKFQLCGSFTFIGLLYMIFIDFLLKLEVFILVLVLLITSLFTKPQLTNRVRQFFEQAKLYVFNLTFFEIESLEKQKKVVQLLFEDILMLIMNVAIYSGIVNVPKIHSQLSHIGILHISILNQQFIMTLLNMYIVFKGIKQESNGLLENYIEYIMTSVKAKLDWVPFNKQLKNGTLRSNIDFSIIEFKKPLMSNLIGSYHSFEYQFNEQGLQELTTSLLFLLENKKEEINIPKIKFGFSFYSINAHQFLHFVNQIQMDHSQFVINNINFDEIDWKQLIKNSKFDGLFKTKYSSKSQDEESGSDKIKAVTIGGKSLLQICIENEQPDKWPLSDLMELLLETGCDPNIREFKKGQDMLLSFCHKEKKHKAFEMMVKVGQADPNARNSNKSSTFGMLFYQASLQRYDNSQWKAKQHLQLIHQNTEKIDMHNRCVWVEQLNLLCTPVYWYQERIVPEICLERDQQKNEIDIRQEWFGSQSFKLQKNIEYFELFKLFQYKTQRSNIEKFLQSILVNTNLDSILKGEDDDQNNLMHITDCFFSENNFPKFLSKNDQNYLFEILRDLLKQKNKHDKTPIQNMIESKSNIRKLNRLLDYDLIEEDTFNGIEEQILQYVYDSAREYHHLKKQKGDFEKLDIQKFFNSFQYPRQAKKHMKRLCIRMSDRDVLENYFTSEEQYEQIENLRNRASSFRIQNISTIAGINDNQKRYFQAFDFKEVNIQKFIHYQNKQKDEDKYNEIKISQISSENVLKRQKKCCNIGEQLINSLIEITAMIDFISDSVILYYLSRTPHSAWFSFSLFTMICPYYAVYTSLMNFQIRQVRQLLGNESENKTIKCSKLITLYLQILPTMVILVFLIDIISMIIFIVKAPFVLMKEIFNCDIKIMEQADQRFDEFIQRKTNLSTNDIKGFRLQRTITQLMLESLPQVCFQIYMLIRIDQLKLDGKFIDLDEKTIVWSLISALIHLILEWLNLWIESKVYQCNITEYMVACYNAKQGWIPHHNRLLSRQVRDQDNKSEDEIDIYQKDEIDFDQKDVNYHGYTPSFIFTDEKVDNLISILSNLPKFDQKEKRKTIQLGNCISKLSIHKLLEIIRFSHEKVEIKFTDLDLIREIIKKDDIFYKSLKEDPPKEIKDLKNIPIINIIQKDQFQLFKLMAEMGAKLNIEFKHINETHTSPHQHTDSLITYAIEQKQMKYVRYMLQYYEDDKEHFNKWMAAKDLFWKEVCQSDILNKKDQLNDDVRDYNIILNPQRRIPFEMINKHIHKYRIWQNYNKNPLVYKKHYDVLFGAYIPDFDFKVGDLNQSEQCIDLFIKWTRLYPENLIITEGELEASFDTKYLSLFIAFRRYIHKKLFKDNILEFQDRDYPKSIDIHDLFERSQLDRTSTNVTFFQYNNLDKLKDVYEIMFNHPGNVQIEISELKACDDLIIQLGLDKKRSLYFHNSRKYTMNIEDQFDWKNTDTWNWKIQDDQDEYQIPQNVLAVKSLEINAEIKENADIPDSFQLICLFDFDFGHVKSKGMEIKLEFNQRIFNQVNRHTKILIDFKEDQNQEANQYGLDYNMKNFAETVKNSLEGGNKIKMRLKNHDIGQNLYEAIDIKLEFEFYMKIQHQSLPPSLSKAFSRKERKSTYVKRH